MSTLLFIWIIVWLFHARINNGVLPTAADVYEKTHYVVVGKGETDLIGERANKIMEEYNEKLNDYKKKGIEKDPNDVYLEVVGGQKKRESLRFKECFTNVL